MANEPTLVAGAGIAGLTLALSLARHGLSSVVLEARGAPDRQGAGIQLGPNATRLLLQLDLGAALRPHVVSPTHIRIHNGATGRVLTNLPLGDWLGARHSAPYWVINRADLHNVLWNAADAEPLIELRMNCAVDHVTVDESGRTVSVRTADGDERAGAALIGADGLWSVVRGYVAPEIELEYAGAIAARALAPSAAMPPLFAQSATGVWLSSGAHVVHYPVNAGRDIAIVVIGAGERPSDDWSSSVDQNLVRQRAGAMAAHLDDLLAAAGPWRQWPLYRLSRSFPWSRGPVAVIGDAAHPILPFLAQGGALAIEDAAELAAALASNHAGGHAPAALATFAAKRAARVARVAAASAENGRAYHLTGAAANARNLALGILPGHLFMRRYDWIYGYRATAT